MELRMTTTPNPPAELPDEPTPEVTIELKFVPFDPLDPALRAVGSVALHTLGLLLTGFELRQWPGVHRGLVRVDFPRSPRGQVVAFSLRLRDLMARAYVAQAERRRDAKAAVHCCPAVSLFEADPPVHSTNCPYRTLELRSLSRPTWDPEDLDYLAAQMTDTFAAGRVADVCNTLAGLPPVEAAIVAIRILTPAPGCGDVPEAVTPPALVHALGATLEAGRG